MTIVALASLIASVWAACEAGAAAVDWFYADRRPMVVTVKTVLADAAIVSACGCCAITSAYALYRIWG